MKRTVPYDDARRILEKVSSSNAFWLCTNRNLKSLTELAETLECVDDDVFRYHVTRDKNDFEAWIREVVLDKELAREIARVKTKETLIRKISERVLRLRKVIQQHQAVSSRETRSVVQKPYSVGRLQKARKTKTATKKRRKKVREPVSEAKIPSKRRIVIKVRAKHDPLKAAIYR